MTLITEVWVSHPDLVLGDVLASDLDVSIRFEYQTLAEPDERYLFVRVSGVDHDRFDRALREDHTVLDHRLVAMFEGHAVYRLSVDTDIEVVPNECTALGLQVLDVRRDGEGWLLRLHFLIREAFEAFREYCRSSEMTYQVRELSNVEDVEGGYSFGLTEQQRTTLLLAYNAGYYEIPRIASQDELADELGVSKSAVSQRLRRAITVLIENTLVNL